MEFLARNGVNSRQLLLVIAALLLSACGQSDQSAWQEEALAAVEAAIPEAEKDLTRPVYHFRPPAQWMNDICAAIYYNGYHHIFYQFNPFDDTWGADNSTWAHARSKDLVYWEDLPGPLCLWSIGARNHVTREV